MGTSNTQKPAQAPRKPPAIDIERPGRMRAKDIVQLLNISLATWYSGLKSGRYPPADGRDGQLVWWSTATIRPLIEPKK